MSTVLMFTVLTVLKLCWPTHSTSSVVAHGMARWMPALHCVDEGSFAL